MEWELVKENYAPARRGRTAAALQQGAAPPSAEASRELEERRRRVVGARGVQGAGGAPPSAGSCLLRSVG